MTSPSPPVSSLPYVEATVNVFEAFVDHCRKPVGLLAGIGFEFLGLPGKVLSHIVFRDKPLELLVKMFLVEFHGAELVVSVW